ncbi:MAG TPA: glycosyltransferase, partial [Arcobacter sp.]|nr:glycosyltransferase [Arcobacter sp.]
IDVSLAPLKKSDTFKSVIPSKIFEASAMRKPTLLGVEGEAKRIINNYEAGLCFEPENEKDFIEKVYFLKDNPQKYLDFQKGCISLAISYDRKTLAYEMLKILKSEVRVEELVSSKVS